MLLGTAAAAAAAVHVNASGQPVNEPQRPKVYLPGVFNKVQDYILNF